jgi:hypothetical protein
MSEGLMRIRNRFPRRVQSMRLQPLVGRFLSTFMLPGRRMLARYDIWQSQVHRAK